MVWAASLWLGALLSSVSSPGPRYECDVRPGPPVRVQVYQGVGSQRCPVGPALTYRHPGKMASAADLDGDGHLDLLVLVHKKTRYDPKLAWRPFVYTLRDGRWIPKWLGSRVGRPLLEGALVHTPNGVKLLTVEDFGEGKTGLTLYHWRGFGFWGEWTEEPGPAQSELQVIDADGDGTDEIALSVGGRRRTYVFRDGGYVPVAKPCEETRP
jgi:hypothetical protein